MKKGEVRKKDEEEMSYEVKKLLDDRKVKGVWEIELKWKDDVNTTREPMAIIELDQPKMVKDYMNELCKQKEVLTLQKKTKTKERSPKKKVDKKYKKKHDVRASYNIEEDVRSFTANGKKKNVKCKDCYLILIPENSKPVYL